MAITVGGTTITFNDGSTQNKAGTTYDDLKLQATVVDSPVQGGISWSTFYNFGTSAYQNVRGRYYVTRFKYGYGTLVDPTYGASYTGTGAIWYNTSTTSNDQITFTNTSNKSIQVKVRAYNGRWTDDTDYNIVYRGGSISNPYTHSGGTQLASQGGEINYIDTIPANTSYTYYHYSGIPGGSGGDQVNAYFTVSFYNWV